MSSQETSVVWVEAAEFQTLGGWVLDTQYVHLMGAPCLVAQGVGEPVPDAVTRVSIPHGGRWYLWVRCRDWDPPHSPGRFRVLVNDATSELLGKAPDDRWAWQAGGSFSLEPGVASLTLKDVSGFFGRMSSLVLTDDPSYQPPDDLESFQRERLMRCGRRTDPEFCGSWDVVVVGAGVAGSCAGLAAARHGARVLVLQDRPMPGGNASVELGVCVDGAASRQRHAREGGIVEECNRRRIAAKESRWSSTLQDAFDAEPNLTTHRNRRVAGVRMESEKSLRGVDAMDVLTGERYHYDAKLFIDATGDGWVGYFAGAERMFGREERSRWNESLAPEVADAVTMSGCLIGPKGLSLRAEPTDTDQPFSGVPWAPHFKDDASFGRQVRNVTGGNWWMEHRGSVDDLWGGEQARDELIRITFGYWDYVKNRWSGRAEAAKHRLVWVPISNGRREGFRLVGDYVLTQNDVVGAFDFEDVIGHGGWPLDVHHPEGIYSGAEGPFHSNMHVPLHKIPYRCCYSKNIENLMMAGRCMSVSHVALGTVRVQGTLGVIGQAVGTAAALALRHHTTPRGIYEGHLKELQQTLLKDDLFLPDLQNQDPADLARSAHVTASSVADRETWLDLNLRGGHWVELDQARAVSFPREGDRALTELHLLLRSRSTEAVTLHAHLREADQPGDFEDSRDVAVATVTVLPGKSAWCCFPVSALTTLRYYWVWLEPASGVDWWYMTNEPLDVWGAHSPNGAAPWQAKNNTSYALLTEAPDATPLDYSPAQVINGISRMTGHQTNQWASDPARSLPQWLQLEWQVPVTFNTIHLTFDTDMNRPPMAYSPAPAGVPQCVKDYTLEAEVDGSWISIVVEKNNILRKRIHRIPELKASRLRVIVHAPHGDASARIFEVRVYKE